MQSILRTAYQGQILQSPIVSGGRIFKNQWVKWFTPAQLPVLQQIILSVDASFVDTPDACPASIQVWGKRSADYYLLYDETARMTAKSTLARIETIARMYQGCTVVVEKAANGYFIIQELQNKLSTYGFDPKKYGGKEVRAEMVAPLWENGNVYIADTIYNRTKYIVEILNFPNCEYVDRVDAMAQALLYFTRAQIIGGSFV
jgi:predicted phage terminase large subunit-like protein